MENKVKNLYIFIQNIFIQNILYKKVLVTHTHTLLTFLVCFFMFGCFFSFG